MAGPVRAGHWLVFVTVCGTLLVAGWPTVSPALQPLRDWGSGVSGPFQLVALVAFFLSAHGVKRRRRADSHAPGPPQDHPHD